MPLNNFGALMQIMVIIKPSNTALYEHFKNVLKLDIFEDFVDKAATF